MANVSENLNTILNIKNDIRTSIFNKGVEIDIDTPFNDYPAKIDSIIAGGDGEIEEKYKQYNFDYVIDENYLLDIANKSYEVTKDWVEYNDDNHIINSTDVYFIPNLPVTIPNFSAFFSYAKNLLKIPLLNTAGQRNFASTFANCIKLNTIPLLDTSSATTFLSAFENCYSLESIPLINTSNVINMSYMFYNCLNLETIPQLNTSNVSNVQYMFYGCKKLKSLPKLDFSSVSINMTYVNSFLTGNSSATSSTNNFIYLTDLGGFTGLKINFWLNGCQNLTEQSIINVFNEMADLTGETAQTVHLGNKNIAKCSPQTLQIATDKNWLVQ